MRSIFFCLLIMVCGMSYGMNDFVLNSTEFANHDSFRHYTHVMIKTFHPNWIGQVYLPKRQH